VTYERALETRESSCVPKSAKTFFIPVVHSPLGAVGHVAAPEFPSQEGRAWNCGTHGSTGAHLSKEARSGAEGHVAAPELTSARKQGPELRDTWQRRSSPQQGGEVRGYRTRGNVGAHISKEARSGAAGHVKAPTLGGARAHLCREV
jgi:hypothetical protein